MTPAVDDRSFTTSRDAHVTNCRQKGIEEFFDFIDTLKLIKLLAKAIFCSLQYNEKISSGVDFTKFCSLSKKIPWKKIQHSISPIIDS